MDEQKTIYDISAEMVERVNDKYDINLYEKILELRKFEIDNFWKRAIFFWGTISLLYLGFFRLGEDSQYFSIISLMGLLFNIIFSLSIRGSKYWQEHYEDLASQYEHGMNFILFSHKKPTFELFSKKDSVFSVPHRFSVSKLAMLLADISTIVWLLLWVKSLIDSSQNLYFEFGWNNSIHLPTIFIILSQLIPMAYFIFFLKYGKVYHKPTEGFNFRNYYDVDNRTKRPNKKGDDPTTIIF